MAEHAHAFCIVIAVALGGSNVIALYWLARQDNLIRDMARALLNGTNQIEYASGVIAGQRDRIVMLEAEIDRVRESLREPNIIELPRRGPR